MNWNFRFFICILVFFTLSSMRERNARKRISPQTQMLFLCDTRGTRDIGNRGHEPKIISVCCSILRDSLWESRQSTLVAGRETIEAAKYFSAPDVLFFGRTESVNSRIQTFLHPEWQRICLRFFHRSFRSLIETATFFYSILCPPHLDPPCRLLRGFSDKERHGGDICHKGKVGRKRSDMDKRSEVRQTETNSRKQGSSEAERAWKGQLLERLRTHRRRLLPYNAFCLGLTLFLYKFGIA